MSYQVSEEPSFLRLHNIPLPVETTLYRFICYWTLRLLPPSAYRYLLESLLSITLGPCPEVELLGHMVILCLIF